jgi:hypothetical protein
MTIQERLNTLIAAATAVGIDVERVPMGGEGGGLAILAGKRRLFVDTMADSTTAYETTLAALANLQEIQALDLPEQVRTDLEQARDSRP